MQKDGGTGPAGLRRKGKPRLWTRENTRSALVVVLPSSPWWNPNHCSARDADTHTLKCHFCEVELGRLFVADVNFFIIIIIIDIIVSLPPCFTNPKCWTHRLAVDAPPPPFPPHPPGDLTGRGCAFGTTVMVLLAGRLQASVHFFFPPCKY